MDDKKDLRKNLRIPEWLHKELKVLSSELGFTMIKCLSELIKAKRKEIEEKKDKELNVRPEKVLPTPKQD